MRHDPQRNIRAAMLLAALFCAAGHGMAQTSLQEALLRAPVESAALPEPESGTEPATSVEAALQQVAAQAAVIFTGSVSSVKPDASGGAEVKFAVERSVRGLPAGAAYAIHVSPWAGGAERYYPGERALFLLTAPAVSGYSAPVMGEHGIVPLSGDALVGNLDLRWIAADVQRRETVGPAAEWALAIARTQGASPQSAAEVPAVAASSPLPDVQSIDRDLVLDLLRGTAVAAGQTRR